MKTRRITIHTNKVFKDIDDLTYKYAEASSIPSPRVENAIMSDSTEGMDGHILARNVEYRDAIIRSRMSSCLRSEAVQEADNSLSVAACIVYDLCLDDEYEDSGLKVLAVLIHRYLVWGALYDWYAAGMGSAQANAYAAQLSAIESQIINKTRASVAKRPLQPFGPRRMP